MIDPIQLYRLPIIDMIDGILMSKVFSIAYIRGRLLMDDPTEPTRGRPYLNDPRRRPLGTRQKVALYSSFL